VVVVGIITKIVAAAAEPAVYKWVLLIYQALQDLLFLTLSARVVMVAQVDQVLQTALMVEILLLAQVAKRGIYLQQAAEPVVVEAQQLQTAHPADAEVQVRVQAAPKAPAVAAEVLDHQELLVETPVTHLRAVLVHKAILVLMVVGVQVLQDYPAAVFLSIITALAAAE
jgi:hypothetical protein